MQRLEVSGAVRPLCGSLGVKGLMYKTAFTPDLGISFNLIVLSILLTAAVFKEFGGRKCGIFSVTLMFIFPKGLGED